MELEARLGQLARLTSPGDPVVSIDMILTTAAKGGQAVTGAEATLAAALRGTVLRVMP